jgi:hypothetical protein
MKKNPWAMSDEQVFFAELDKFYDEAADGMMRLYLVRGTDMELRKAVQRGDPLAMTLARACGLALQDLRATRKYCCVFCCDPFADADPHAFAVLLPGSKTEEKPRQHGTVITQPICADCSAEPDRKLLEDAFEFLRQILPASEQIEGMYKER